MTPTIGRIIHLDTVRGCVAAIITGDIVDLYSATAKTGEPDAWRFKATAFPAIGPTAEGARKMQVNADTNWHDPRECGR